MVVIWLLLEASFALIEYNHQLAALRPYCERACQGSIADARAEYGILDKDDARQIKTCLKTCIK